MLRAHWGQYEFDNPLMGPLRILQSYGLEGYPGPQPGSEAQAGAVVRRTRTSVNLSRT